MKGRILSLGWALIALAGTGHRESAAATMATLGRWDFNSVPPDSSATTGSTAPTPDAGTASVLGGVSATFAAGSAIDPAADNSSWNTAGYPGAGAANKTAGVEFRWSTRGYSNIVVSWEQRLSGSASRYSRFQYSLNGADFIDGPVLEFTTNNTFLARSVSLSSIPALVNNPNFAFRIVAEFQSTATGAGAAAYVTPLGANYSGSGTVRFDAVRIEGIPMRPANTPPTIQPVADLRTIENQAVGASIEIGDDATRAGELRVQARSSNPELIPDSQIVISGGGYVRPMTVTPRTGQSGQAVVTLTAMDEENLTASASFTVIVAPLNAPPSISGILSQRRVIGDASTLVPFEIGDAETAAGALQVSARSSNPSLIDTAGLILGGTGSDRTLQLTPIAGVTGTAQISVDVEDAGGRRATSSFPLMVVPSTGVLMWETFGYGDGSLVTNSAGAWLTHGGTTGQVQVGHSGVTVTSSRTEDVHAMLASPALAAGTLYVAFGVSFTSLPSASEYFAHLNHAGGSRARLYAGTNNAARGSFRLGVGNGGASALGQVPTDLNLNTAYTVVVRYEVGSAQSALWINPSSELDPAAVAGDDVSSVSIQSISLRNNAGIGTMTISSLRVGSSFADVTGAALGWALTAERAGDAVEVSWPAAATGYRLQSKAGPNPGGWTDELTVPTVNGARVSVRVPTTGGERFFRLTR